MDYSIVDEQLKKRRKFLLPFPPGRAVYIHNAGKGGFHV
jgi:hypothetical protein